MVSKTLYIFLVIFSIYYDVTRSEKNVDMCRKCKPGLYAKHQCSNDNEMFHDTICAPCLSGTFMPLDDNEATECTPCKVCPKGTYISEQCSSASDTQCNSCDVITDSESYRTLCQGVKTSSLKITEDRIKLSSSEEEEEGSGKVDEIIVTNTKHAKPLVDDVLLAEDEDGSGETNLTIPSSSELVLGEDRTTLNPNVNLDLDIEELITVSTASVKVTTSAPSTTTKQATASPTKPTTTRVTTQPTVTTTKTTLTTTTTVPVKTIDIGVGINIKQDEHSDESDVENVIVTLPEKPTQTETNNIPSRSAVSDRKGALSDDSDKVSIGIVIAVAIIAALVFFAIGFIVSKYCRRRRETFKTMKAQNGHHNGSVPILIENGKTYRPNGIYDEIGKEASNSNLKEIVPVHAENVYAVPEKRKKAESGDEIKYIDETSDDEPDSGDKENQQTNNDVTEPLLTSPQNEEEVPENNVDESSPMLNEIQSEMENHQDQIQETDALMNTSEVV